MKGSGVAALLEGWRACKWPRLASFSDHSVSVDVLLLTEIYRVYLSLRAVAQMDVGVLPTLGTYC